MTRSSTTFSDMDLFVNLYSTGKVVSAWCLYKMSYWYCSLVLSEKSIETVFIYTRNSNNYDTLK